MWLALLVGAHAAVPFELPPGERAADWSGPLALAGFAPGEGGGGACAELIAESATSWRLVVHDAAGHVRTVPVSAPRSDRERQDVAWMAESLLDPVVPPSAPAPPVPPRSAPPPATRRGAGTPKAPSPASIAPVDPLPPPAPLLPPEPAASPAPLPPPEPPAPPASLPQPAPPEPPAPPLPNEGIVTTSTEAAIPAPTFDVALGGGARLRDGVGVAGLYEAAIGVRAGSFRVGVGVEGLGAAPLARLDAELDGSIVSAAVSATVGWTSPARLGPDVSIGVAVANNRFLQGGRLLGAAWVPAIVGDAGGHLALGHSLQLAVSVRGSVDTRPPRLTVDGADAATFSVWAVTPALRLVYAPSFSDE